jgi:hypothetical protein
MMLSFDGRYWFWHGFGDAAAGHSGRASTRWRKRAKPVRPNMLLLISLSLFIRPSRLPLFHGSVKPAATACGFRLKIDPGFRGKVNPPRLMCSMTCCTGWRQVARVVPSVWVDPEPEERPNEVR